MANTSPMLIYKRKLNRKVSRLNKRIQEKKQQKEQLKKDYQEAKAFINDVENIKAFNDAIRSYPALYELYRDAKSEKTLYEFKKYARTNFIHGNGVDPDAPKDNSPEYRVLEMREEANTQGFNEVSALIDKFTTSQELVKEYEKKQSKAKVILALILGGSILAVGSYGMARHAIKEKFETSAEFINSEFMKYDKENKYSDPESMYKLLANGTEEEQEAFFTALLQAECSNTFGRDPNNYEASIAYGTDQTIYGNPNADSYTQTSETKIYSISYNDPNNPDNSEEVCSLEEFSNEFSSETTTRGDMPNSVVEAVKVVNGENKPSLFKRLLEILRAQKGLEKVKTKESKAKQDTTIDYER